MALRLEPFSLEHATDEAWLSFGEIEREAEAESWPHQGPTPPEAHRFRLTHLPPVLVGHFWGLWDDRKLIGVGRAFVMDSLTNRHVLRGHLYVRPSHRRRGHARRLLQPILELGRTQGRTLLVGHSIARVSDGELGARGLGARLAMQIDASLLNLQGVDAGLMDKWRTRADGFETEYETVFWDGLVPEDQLDAYLRHKMAMNQAPREDLEVEDDEPDRRRYRQMEKHYAALGRESFQLALWHRESEQFVGSSHLYWDPHTPTGLNQGDTVVLESFRGRGLGCWLKAEMFRQIQIRKPEVQWILTGNAGSNAPMLSINRQMGFRPYDTMQVWQMDIGGI